jgi:ATP-binding cassette subfamily C protein LapB
MALDGKSFIEEQAARPGLKRQKAAAPRAGLFGALLHRRARHATAGTALANPNPAPPELPETHSDPILGALLYLAKLWGRPLSKDVLTAGLPLADGRLTSKLIGRALERIGLKGTYVRQSLARLADFDMPALLAGPGGAVLICVARNPDGSLKCYDAETDSEIVLRNKQLRFKTRRRLLLIKPTAETSEAGFSGKKRKEHWLRSALAGHWHSVFYVMLAAVFINLFAIAFPFFSMNVYDRVLPNKATSTLWVLAIGMLLVLLFDMALKVARGGIIDYVGRKIDFRLSSALFDRVLNTSLSARPASTGAFVNRISQYEVLRDFFTSSTIVMFVDILFMGVFAYVIASLIGWVVIFPLLAGVISIICTLTIGIKSGASVEAALAESSARNSILVETLSSAQTVKATRAEGQFLRRWENTILASSETQNKIKSYQSIATQITGMASQVSLISIVVAGTYQFGAGEVTMGAIVGAMMLSNRLIAPIAQISAALLRTRSATEAYKTLSNIMALPDERAVRNSFVGRSVSTGKIEFRKVRFAYPGSQQFVLDNVSFAINPGEKVGIIGRIGSGKTTLGRLLVNFYAPSEGEILVDDVAIGQYHPVELRRQVGLVLQDPELFNGTVKDNIILSDPTASNERLLAVAKRAGVDEFVGRHPMGFDMPVGERGNLLSGGQRQAIALARTMLVDPKILFLDEPSSSMDLATERQLIGHLSTSLAPEHTVLIATHRFSLLSLVSRLIVIDNGRIVADGPREAVLAQLRARGENA